MGVPWFKIEDISYGWFVMRLGQHHCEASDFLGYDMPQKLLNKLIRVIREHADEWLYLMNEPGASMLRIAFDGERIRLEEYGMSVDSTDLRGDDEKQHRDQRKERVFELQVDVREVVDGLVTEFSLYESGNGRRMYEEHWGAFPQREFDWLKTYAFRLQKEASASDSLLCTTFLEQEPHRLFHRKH